MAIDTPQTPSDLAVERIFPYTEGEANSPKAWNYFDHADQRIANGKSPASVFKSVDVMLKASAADGVSEDDSLALTRLLSTAISSYTQDDGTRFSTETSSNTMNDGETDGVDEDPLSEVTYEDAELPATDKLPTLGAIELTEEEKKEKRKKNLTEIIQELVSRGAVVDSVSLFHAVYHGDADLVEMVLAGKAIDLSKEKDKVSKEKDKILLDGVNTGEPRIVRDLLDKGAPVDVVDYEGRGPMHLAADLDSGKNMQAIEIIHLLHSHNADPNLRDKDGNTPLHHAVFFGQARAQAIILAGGDLMARNKGGDIPLQYFASLPKLDYEQIQTANYLLYCPKTEAAHRALVNNQDNEGNTMLHDAALISSKEGIDFAISAGVDWRLQNNQKQTARDIVQKQLDGEDKKWAEFRGETEKSVALTAPQKKEQIQMMEEWHQEEVTRCKSILKQLRDYEEKDKTPAPPEKSSGAPPSASMRKALEDFHSGKSAVSTEPPQLMALKPAQTPLPGKDSAQTARG